jgi:antitoxin component YwqK of YwqJK toxin-antitoxin module
MEHWLNNLIRLSIVSLSILSLFACKQNVKTTDNQTLVDTLGFQMERKIVEYFDDSTVQKVHYVKNNKELYEISFHRNGIKYVEGWYEDGQREGNWVSWYPNGKKWSYGFYEKGIRSGKSEAYYEDGTVRVEQGYKKGIPNGVWKFYTQQGKLELEVEYRNGEKVDEMRY